MRLTILGEGHCCSVSTYEKLNELGEGSRQSENRTRFLRLSTDTRAVTAYGVVYRARHTASSRIVALKQVRILADERQNGVPITALREISILRSLKHTNIINVIEVAVGDKEMDEIYMAMEYVEQVGDPLLKAAA